MENDNRYADAEKAYETKAVLRSIDDRTPLEAAIARLDEQATRLENQVRVHAERLAPILRPDHGTSAPREDKDRPAFSERVVQLDYLASRFYDAIDALADLTPRVEA